MNSSIPYSFTYYACFSLLLMADMKYNMKESDFMNYNDYICINQKYIIYISNNKVTNCNTTPRFTRITTL